jgi:FkbM family methyltransferase
VGRGRLTATPGDTHFGAFAIGAYGRDSWVVAMEYLKHARTFIDVGAHIGHFTYNALSRFRSVVAIEPVTANFGCLNDNVRRRVDALKHKPGVRLIQAVCGDECRGKADVWMVDPSGGKNSGAWEMRFTPHDGVPKVEIDVITVDELNLARVDLIKIDVQGGERAVIRGAAKTIARERPVLIVEVTANDNIDNELIEIVSSHGYQLKALVQKNGIFLATGPRP